MKTNKLKQLRLNQNLSQEKVAKAVNITKQQYSRIENNKQHGSLKVWKALAKFFGTTIDDLLTEESDEIVAQNETVNPPVSA